MLAIGFGKMVAPLAGSGIAKALGVGQEGVLTLVSLEGLGLEAVLDRHGGCRLLLCESDLKRPMLQES